MNRTAFALSDAITAMVVALLITIYTYSMIGCGDGGGADSKNANDLKKTRDELESARRNARQMQNSTHLRGIHSGMILFAQGNRDYYPGLDSRGAKAMESVAAKPGASFGFGTADGALVAYRFAVLLRGNYFSPGYMISPAESNKGISAPEVGKNFADGSGYSYAMLNITDLTQPRTGEWRATNSSRPPVLSDRNIGAGASGASSASIHSEPGQGWRGSVCFNDNHANFEVSDVLKKTEYALKGDIEADKLFSDQEKPAAGPSGADAAMVFKAGDSYINQNP